MTGRLVSAVVVLWSALAAAQASVPGFELERLTLNPGARETLVLSTGDTLPALSLRAGLWGHYQHDPLVLYSGGTRLGAYVGSRVTAHVLAAYGITDWAEVGLALPVVLYQVGDDLSAQGWARPTSTAIGVPWIQGRFGVLRQRDGQPVDLSLQLGVGRDFGGLLRVGAELGATIRGVQALSSTVTADEVGSLFAGGVTASTVGLPVQVELTFRGEVPFTRAPVGAELLAGLRWPLNDRTVELSALGGLGLGRTPGIPAFRVLVGLSWTPFFGTRGPDCREPATADVKACPELDRDGDGFPNGADACPTEEGVRTRRGCPDVDTDGDTVLDEVDRCPTEKGPPASAGCPVDTDKDGLEDGVDACPAEAGPPELKGCPRRDTDGDGVEDSVDACPAVKGEIVLRGCPDKDRDADAVMDLRDNCPDVKGTPENAGCPADDQQIVAIEASRLLIKERVFFETARSVILPRSYRLLRQVASVLKAHPEITRVRVEGHTDAQGGREVNIALSQARASAVVEHLVGEGVDSARLEARGYGPDQPADSNATAKGRENNRRVEFVIVTE